MDTKQSIFSHELKTRRVTSRMRSMHLKHFVIIGCALTVVYAAISVGSYRIGWFNIQANEQKPQEDIHVAIVLCGDKKWHEAVMLIKSTLYFNSDPVHFHVIIDQSVLKQNLEKLFLSWEAELQEKVNYTFYDEGANRNNSKQTGVPRNLFKPCAQTRLYLHMLLPAELDWVLYFDSDTLVLRPLRPLWDLKRSLNSTLHVVAATPLEPVLSNKGYGVRNIPYPLPTGMNSGMMLMNLKLKREMGWLDLVKEYYDKYKRRVRFDQDIYNAIFHFHPEYLSYVPPEWGFASAYCRCDENFKKPEYVNNDRCQALWRSGPSLIHASSSLFVLPGNRFGIGQTFRTLHQCLEQKMAMGHRFNRRLIPDSVYNYSRPTTDQDHETCSYILFRSLEQEDYEVI